MQSVSLNDEYSILHAPRMLSERVFSFVDTLDSIVSSKFRQCEDRTIESSLHRIESWNCGLDKRKAL